MSTESVDPRYASYQRPQTLKDRLSAMTVKEGAQSIKGSSAAIIAGRWHDYIVDKLLVGALDTLNECGVDDDHVDLITAPGAFEFPLVAKKLAATGRYQLLVALGVVIRGETPHFDYVAGECANGLAVVSRESEIPIGFGLLTVNNVDQALARAQPGDANKGREAVLAAAEVVDLARQLATQ